MLTTKTKILFVHHGKGLGGAPLSLFYLINGLDKKKYEPVVVFLHQSDVIHLYESAGIIVDGPLETMDFPHTKIWWLRWYHVITLLKAIKDTFKTAFFIAPAMLKKHKPDIVHLNTSSLVGWGYAAKHKKIPVVWHIREPLADGYTGLRKQFIKRSVATKATAIVPICHNDALPWKKNSKTTVVYNAVDPLRFDFALSAQSFLSENSIPNDKPIVLFLGGLSQEKGTHIILQAFKKLLITLPEAHLIIAGNFVAQPKQNSIKKWFPASRFAQNVHELIRDCGKNVHVLGPIFNVPEAMAASSIIVFPATVGHFARPIIEAGFMKKPVIATQVAPLQELVKNGVTGFLVDSTDIDAWKEKMLFLLTHPDTATQMGDAAFDFCTQTFNIKTHVQAIEKIYSQITHKGDVV